MTKQDQIKELAEVIRKDYPEVNADHIATIAVKWFDELQKKLDKRLPIGNPFILDSINNETRYE
jgi:hypothetical protein